MRQRFWIPSNLKPNQFKAWLVKAKEDGQSNGQIAETWGASLHMVSLWLRRFGITQISRRRAITEATARSEALGVADVETLPCDELFALDPTWRMHSPELTQWAAENGYVVVNEDALFGHDEPWLEDVWIPDQKEQKVLFTHSKVR